LNDAGADDTLIRAAAKELAASQRADGGWGQLNRLPSDPYATATALVALHEAGGLATDSPAYRRGVSFLVRTQRSDGSWYVKSRSRPFQPYYESGFPYGKDQFISASASGWAATALILTLPARTDAAPAP
jgi:squalene cyclase